MYLLGRGRIGAPKPLYKRLKLLEQCLPPSERFHKIETFSDGKSLWKGIEQLGLEGMVAKVPSSLYRKGKDASWLKIKTGNNNRFMSGEIKFKSNSLIAVCLGMVLNDELRYVGTVSGGVSCILRSEVAESLQERASSPFKHGLGPFPSRDETIRWVEPTLLLKTQFLEWNDEGKLRHARIIE